jgi:hypothetical protein
VGVEETLQDENGSDLVDDSAMFGARASRGMQVAMGFGGGKALVPEVDGQAGFVAQELGESLSLRGLGTLISGHVEGVADDDLGAAVFADEAGERFEVPLAVGAREGEDGLRGEAERVGDSDANAAVSDVEAYQPGGSGSW